MVPGWVENVNPVLTRFSNVCFHMPIRGRNGLVSVRKLACNLDWVVFELFLGCFQGVSVLVPRWFRVGSGFGGSGLVPGWKIDLQPGLGWFRVGKFQPIAKSN